MIYMLAVFFPWLAFFLRGRIFSAIFSFILWIILCLPMIVAIVATFIPDLREYLGFLLAYGFALQIAWFFGSFLLWVVLTTWCCLVMHGDQRRKEMEQLINAIETNSGKSLHYETQQANKTDKAWDLVIVFCILIGLAVLAVFFIKGKHHSSNDPNNNPKSGVEKLKNPSHIKLKNGNNHSRTQNHPKHKNNKGAEVKERQGE
ncbi:flagellar biosynthesis protein FlgG [Helicobacter pylori]|uniref:flagellar biosynthesis protein FlgG n=1 Tax=Helicobacter pylori TaxID=210 RepID=UPI000BEE442C|nr:flagellar biosynthesis protein FlgG [Helicobacter pylori]PDW18511.1 flagellar biosynthesis protein FlgG [Helicobacter pylori]